MVYVSTWLPQSHLYTETLTNAKYWREWDTILNTCVKCSKLSMNLKINSPPVLRLKALTRALDFSVAGRPPHSIRAMHDASTAHLNHRFTRHISEFYGNWQNRRCLFTPDLRLFKSNTARDEDISANSQT